MGLYLIASRRSSDPKEKYEIRVAMFTRDHQSTDFPCPLPLTISGARYSGVPQKVYVFRFPTTPYFDKPKSVSFIWPSPSNKTFSGFKSL